METQTTKTKVKKPRPSEAAEDLGLDTGETTHDFERGERIGLNIIRMPIGSKNFFRVLGTREIETKRYGTLPAADVICLKTGTEGIIWLDGALKYQFSQMDFPCNLEIEKLEKVTTDVVIDGKVQEKDVNSYNIWKLKDQA